MIVEDEVMISVFMRDVFENAGLRRARPPKADEALELFKAEEFAAVVSDILMPGMSALGQTRLSAAKRQLLLNLG